MKFKISHSQYWGLKYAIGESLFKALKDRTQREPQLIANMVWHIPQQINSLALHKAGLNIQAGGVYVHQQPQVKCANFPEAMPQSVELGDLLFLRTEKRNGKVSSSSALLLQAKRFRNLPAKLDNNNQHHLYAKWPPFEYVRSTSRLNGKRRYLAGLDLYNACKYLLIGEPPCWCVDRPFCDCIVHFLNNCAVLTAQPSYPHISQYRCFFTELADFILGDAGKSYTSPPPKRSRNWDRLIQDLTDITGKRASSLMRRASSGTSPSRGQCLCFLTGSFSDSVSGLKSLSEAEHMSSDGPPEVPPPDYNDNSTDGGISIIEFVVSTEEERRPQ